MKFNFDNSYADNINIITKLEPELVSKPKVILYNKELGDELGIGKESPELYLSGNRIPEGATPIAMAYSGHQFGHYNILGDGRAILLGEHITDNGLRFDIQLKGSGRTPYSRGGDGKATLSSMLREYIISFGIERLGIPTTRSLAVIESGDPVYRETTHRGALLTRVSSGHIRVGTFEYLAMKRDSTLLKQFTDYTIDRLYPSLSKSREKYLDFYKEVVKRQIDLIVEWMRVGFIHGVMNTDNMSIVGETIDYGPCAFMDRYDPSTVFSSIDRNGRYSFSNQEYIGKWNLARLGESLIPLIDSDTTASLEIINSVLEDYDTSFKRKWVSMMSGKLGFKEELDIKFIREFLNYLEDSHLDYTRTFRDLYRINPLPDNDKFTKWYKKWKELKPQTVIMDSANPNIIPRNHIVEDALFEASRKYNMKPLNNLLEILNNPYVDCDDEYYTNPPIDENPGYRTYCGT